MQIGEIIYLDYQAATPLDKRVLRAMLTAYESHFANPHAADHVLGWRAASAIERAASEVAALVGLQPDDVTFTSGASEANAMAMHAAKAFASQTGRTEVLVGSADHGSILNEANKSGLFVRQIPLDVRGAPDPDALQELFSEETALVSIVGVNNENGAIADLAMISALCKSKGILLHADLSQAPLATDLDMIEFDVPFATVSAHKIYGPKGIGAFLTGPGAGEFVRPLVFGAGQQGGRRGGTMPTELIVAFAEACRLVSQVKDDERRRVAEIRDYFVEKLEETQRASLIGTLEARHPGNALMWFPGCNASELLARLQPHIAASTQSACSSGTLEPSHVLQAMGYDKAIAAECIRFSFGRFSDIDQAKRAVAMIATTLDSEEIETAP